MSHYYYVIYRVDEQEWGSFIAVQDELEFDLAGIQRYINENLGPGVIQDWKQVSKRQYTEYNKLFEVQKDPKGH